MSPASALDSPAGPPHEEAPQLPCWLTEAEVEAIIVMCASSPRSAGDVERRLFAKLGEVFRAFRR